MADRKTYTPPPPPAPDDRTPEEIAAASRPAQMTLDRRGGAPQFESIPAPRVSASQRDVRLTEPVEPGAPAAPAPGAVTPGLPAGGQTMPTGAPDGDIPAYTSKNPESMYDKDIEFTHTLSRMLGMAGLGDRAMNTRDLHMKLQAARIEDVGTQAQRAFLGGDVTKGIDMFNHVVPNGHQIVGYKDNGDGTFSFKMSNGQVDKRKASDITEALAAYTKPELIGAMMKDRAHTLAAFGKDAALAQLKGGIELNKELMVKQYGAQTAMALESWKAQFHNQPRLTSTMDGQVYAAFPGGTVHRVEMKKGLDGKMRPELGPAMQGPPNGGGAVPMGGAAPTGSGGVPTQGTPIDQSRVNIPIAQQYR